MARRNVYLPDELAETVARELPDVNLSQLLQEALAGLLGCDHEALVCAACATPVDRFALIDAALGRYYSDLLWDLDALVRRGATAEGACRVAKEVASRHQVSVAARLPLPRPTKANRRAARIKEFPPPSKPAPAPAAVTESRRASA